MEAVGSAAAVAQLAVMCLQAGKLADDLVKSFFQAPAQISNLNSKLKRLQLLITELESVVVQSPEPESQVLLLPEHRAFLFFGLKKALDSLEHIKSIYNSRPEESVRDRLRWATLDKRRAQRVINEAQSAESELDVLLHIITIRISSMNHHSLALLSAGQASIRATMQPSFDDIKDWFSREIRLLSVQSAVQHPWDESGTQFSGEIRQQKLPTNQVPDSSLPSRKSSQDTYPDCAPLQDFDPRSMLVKHDSRKSLSRFNASFGEDHSLSIPNSAGYRARGSVIVSSKSRSRKATIELGVRYKLVGTCLLKFELRIHFLLCSWALTPSFTLNVAVSYLRPRDSPIFRACQRYDLGEVWYLLKTDQASIRDTDETVGGLLEHVVRGRALSKGLVTTRKKFNKGGQQLLEFLLDQGCNPNPPSAGDSTRLSAFAYAFRDGLVDAVQMMLARQVDLDIHSTTLAGLFDDRSQKALLWKFRLLHSSGFSDWETDKPSSNLLFSACKQKNLDLVLYALVIAGIDPNITTNRSPVLWAAQRGWVEGTSILLECGADPNVCNPFRGSLPTYRTGGTKMAVSEGGHYLLLNGADPLQPDLGGYWGGLDSWGKLITNSCLNTRPNSNCFLYTRFEGSVAHLLFHGANPFEVFTTLTSHNDWPSHPKWFDHLAQVRASDVARIWGTQLHTVCRGRALSNYEVEIPEDKSPTWQFEWNDVGEIRERLDSDDDDFQSQTYSSAKSSGVEFPGAIGYSHSSPTATSSGADTDSSASDIDTYEEDLFFKNATQMHHHTSTERGRRQLSRFPMVRALCDGLQHAGYRADMDDDGDIWYDCDDGDRYFDAWEVQPAEEHQEWLRDICPICQDFEGYGLGRVLERARQGKEKLYEYRRQVAEGRRSAF